MTERLRIAMVALDFHRQGGSEGRTGQLVDALLASGHAVHLVGARIRGAWDPRTILHPLRTVSHPHWLEVLHFSRRAAALIEAGRFDVVHNQIRPFVPGIVTVGGGSHRFYLSEVLPRERGRLRAALRRVLPLHLVLLGLERRGFRPERCPFLIANSQLCRAGILKHYPIPPERIVVAYNGVDSARFSPASRSRHREAKRRDLGVGDGDLAVLFVGQGFSRKGLGTLLDALGSLRLRGLPIRLIVVGRGGRGPWMAQAERLGLGGRVAFVGHVVDPEAFYAAADVFALPTFFDPFANATLEAMASGLPVVTSRSNGAAEVLRPGVDGLVIDRADDVPGLAEALASLTDPDVRAAMGERARETAVKYGWEGALEQTVAVYRAVVEERARAKGGRWRG
ncbi:MAG TPA: glycosyltransferase family 4 protein [Candidatus Methylomirabilis sp.]|nr:glycosyltransferase family 4 protein [Candidatus Methylomirabilis sp.]